MGILRLVRFSLENKCTKIRLEKEYTKKIRIQYETSQEFLLSLMLYFFYLMKILNKNYGLRYKYANNLVFYKIGNTESNIILLTQDFHCIFIYNIKKKIIFAPEKQEAIYFFCKRFMINTSIVVLSKIIIHPIAFSNNNKQLVF